MAVRRTFWSRHLIGSLTRSSWLLPPLISHYTSFCLLTISTSPHPNLGHMTTSKVTCFLPVLHNATPKHPYDDHIPTPSLIDLLSGNYANPPTSWGFSTLKSSFLASLLYWQALGPPSVQMSVHFANRSQISPTPGLNDSSSIFQISNSSSIMLLFVCWHLSSWCWVGLISISRTIVDLSPCPRI